VYRIEIECRRAAKEMHVASLAGTGLSRQENGKWTGEVIRGIRRSRFPAGKAIQGRLDGSEIIKCEKPVGPAAEFSRSLWPAKKEQAEDSCLVAPKIEHGPGTMFILGNPGVTDRGRECKIFKRVETLSDLLLVEIEDGITAGSLVAGVHKRVERERIALRGGDFLLNKRAEYAEGNGIERHATRVPHLRATRTCTSNGADVLKRYLG